MLDLKIDHIVDIRTDSTLIQITWKQPCLVCKKLTNWTKRTTIDNQVYKDYKKAFSIDRLKPKVEPRICSDACKQVRAINPLVYEICPMQE
jgi:hypothetical protein